MKQYEFNIPLQNEKLLIVNKISFPTFYTTYVSFRCVNIVERVNEEISHVLLGNIDIDLFASKSGQHDPRNQAMSLLH